MICAARFVLPAFFLLCLCLCSGLSATDYGVSALKGNDSNPGTLIQPFKTLTKALSVAKSGDRVFVFPGRHSPTLGETFPITVPAGVKVLGSDPRHCVIDAEFKTNVPNPKDPKVNPVQGTVVMIGANCEFAWMSIINGPRNPSDRGAHWWNIALHVNDGGATADNAHVHHCILDEVSRGIFVGYAAGSHNFKNVLIDNCVISRFYVEGINATANGGLVSNNRVLHCTVVGHLDPTLKLNYPRACISFGSGAQFDVRNSVMANARFAGLEAGGTLSITSDHNCFSGSPNAVVGLQKGAKDIEANPGLLFDPTVTTPIDPHHAGPVGPLWLKGTNIITTGNDIDYNNKRLFGSTVDIGADEFVGTDTWFVGQPRVGTTFHVGGYGTANNSMFLALSLGKIPPVSIPGFGGKFELDLTMPNLIVSLPIDSRGFIRQALPIPNATQLAGFEVFIQALDVASLILSDLDRITFIR